MRFFFILFALVHNKSNISSLKRRLRNSKGLQVFLSWWNKPISHQQNKRKTSKKKQTTGKPWFWLRAKTTGFPVLLHPFFRLVSLKDGPLRLRNSSKVVRNSHAGRELLEKAKGLQEQRSSRQSDFCWVPLLLGRSSGAYLYIATCFRLLDGFLLIGG